MEKTITLNEQQLRLMKGLLEEILYPTNSKTIELVAKQIISKLEQE